MIFWALNETPISPPPRRKEITVEQDKRTQDPDEEGLSYGHDVAVIYMNS